MVNYGIKAFLFLFVLSYAPLNSRPLYLKELPPKLKKCRTCHLTRGGRGFNPFGRDFENIKMDKLMEIDSDGDGFINKIEIEKGTNPGDPSDYPAKKKKEFANILIILILSSLIFMVSLSIVLFYIKNMEEKHG